MLKLNHLLKFIFKLRRLLNFLATKWNIPPPPFGVTSFFHKTSVRVNVGLDTLSLLNYAHRLIVVALRNFAITIHWKLRRRGVVLCIISAFRKALE
jgi:hypothetical protein